LIFVDTSFWVALQLPRDASHVEAAELLRHYGRETLVTSNHVRGETWTFLRHRAWHAAAVNFLDAVARTARLSVVFVSEDLEEQALRWLRRHDEREYSFVDATSFRVMHDRRLTEALAFDDDFVAAGFVELRP
jgi:uncharacterized protein